MDNQSETCALTGREGSDERGRYRSLLFQHIPLYTTRLVQEGVISFSARYQITCPSEMANVLQEYYREKDREEFLICLLDTANTLISMSSISTGGLAVSVVEPRRVFKVAVLANAAAIILAHNHPSGNIEPSPEDIALTRKLQSGGEIMGIAIYDHLIITSDEYCSMAERGIV